MNKIALIYWPKKGNTETVANKIFDQFDEGFVDIFTIKEINTAEFALYDAFIIGAPTTGADKWEEAHKTLWQDFFIRLAKADLDGKHFAIFGLGDQVLYPYNYVDGMMDIKKAFEGHGAKHTGSWATEGYEFEDSRSVIDDMFVGLALDEDHQSDKTDERVAKWAQGLKKEFGL